VDWFSFGVGVLVAFCLIMGLPWLIALLCDVCERVMDKIKGGEGAVSVKVKKIREKSVYNVEDADGNVLKVGFKDIEDALEFGYNTLIAKPELKKVVIKATITLEAK